MRLHKNINKILLCSTIVLGLNCLGSSTKSFALNSSDSVEFVNPILNYISLYAPEDSLNKVSASGYSIADIFVKSLVDYEPNVKPLFIDGTIIVNKQYNLPSSFTSAPLAEEAKLKFKEMAEDASKEGIKLTAFSTYRSYDYQNRLYNNYVARDGQAAADRYSARPGSSEHQTCLGYDIGGIDSSRWANSSFHGTKEAEWLEKNSYKYGFILRYWDGKEDITGYKYESWHFRYLGTDLSTKVYESGVTLEEYYGLDTVKDLKEYLPIA